MPDRTHTHQSGLVVEIPDTVAEHEVEGYANRVVAEAEARQADERALIKTIGKGIGGVVATGVSAYAAMVTENLMVAGAAAVIAMFAFGLLTWEQIVELRGLKK